MKQTPVGLFEDAMAAYNRQDYSTALKQFKVLAKGKNAHAQGNLGVMYDKGHGVTQDAVRAHMWFNLAAAGGDEEARRHRDEIAAKMNTQQLAEAQALARHCQDTKFTECQ